MRHYLTLFFYIFFAILYFFIFFKIFTYIFYISLFFLKNKNINDFHFFDLYIFSLNWNRRIVSFFFLLLIFVISTIFSGIFRSIDTVVISFVCFVRFIFVAFIWFLTAFFGLNSSTSSTIFLKSPIQFVYC